MAAGGGGGGQPPDDDGSDLVSWMGSDEMGNPVRYRARLREVKVDVPQADLKVKAEHIDEWDGNPDSVIDWMDQINFIAEKVSAVVYATGSVGSDAFQETRPNLVAHPTQST